MRYVLPYVTKFAFLQNRATDGAFSAHPQFRLHWLRCTLTRTLNTYHNTLRFPLHDKCFPLYKTGRLMEHLLHTPGFTLEFLEFVVIDEADRLLSQSYQNWIPALFDPPPALESQQQHSRDRKSVV